MKSPKNIVKSGPEFEETHFPFFDLGQKFEFFHFDSYELGESENA